VNSKRCIPTLQAGLVYQWIRKSLRFSHCDMLSEAEVRGNSNNNNIIILLHYYSIQ
jgi:hypothetical protein